jgi:hypothetical protein
MKLGEPRDCPAVIQNRVTQFVGATGTRGRDLFPCKLALRTFGERDRKSDQEFVPVCR